MASTTPRHRTAIATLVAVRMLIASYFMASAGLIANEAGVTFLSGVLPDAAAATVATSIFYGTAFLIMVGRFVREAALVLAIFVFWASFSHNLLGMNGDWLAAFWRDMALVGSVLLIGLTLPGGSRGLHLWPRLLQPRRVEPHNVFERRRPRPEPFVPRRPAVSLRRETAEAGDEGEEPNIFANIAGG